MGITSPLKIRGGDVWEVLLVGFSLGGAVEEECPCEDDQYEDGNAETKQG
jgi:hypothetical protein